jgi:hypothetical protein
VKINKFSRHGLEVSVLLLFLAGCASAPTQEELSNANYGRDMTVEECRSVAEQVIAYSLKDPTSAQFRHGICRQGYWSSVPILGMSVAFGWTQEGQVNAKNSFGGYVGFRPYQVLMRDGEAVRYCVADADGLCMASGK